jgi:hypothetical protein
MEPLKINLKLLAAFNSTYTSKQMYLLTANSTGVDPNRLQRFRYPAIPLLRHGNTLFGHVYEPGLPTACCIQMFTPHSAALYC